MSLADKPTRGSFLVQWQSLVMPTYRSLWREFAKVSGWRVTMVAPTVFREGGMQEMPCAAHDPRDPELIALPVKRWHTQAVYFRGLLNTLRTWISGGEDNKIYFCFAEPYSLTALFGAVTFFFARLMAGPGRRNQRRPLFLLYGFQNIYKNFALPLRWLQSMMFRLADGIFVAGKEHELVLRRHGYKGTCLKFPMWFDPEVFFYPENTNPHGPIRVGYAGSLLPEKGISQVLDKLLADASCLEGCALEIAGGGQLREEIEKKVSYLRGMGIHAVYHGPIAAAKMADFYRSVDILMVPSRTAPHWKEQFGRVITEGLACGCVVIGSDSGEIPFVIDDPSRVFPEHDMDAFKNVLSRAIKVLRADRHGERLRMSRLASDKFSDSTIASALYKDLTALLDQSRGSRS